MAESNVIEVLLRSVDQVSADLKNVEARLGGIEKASKNTSHATEELSGHWGKLGSTVVQLNQGIELLEKVFGPVVEKFKEAIHEAAAWEDALAGLNGTLQAFGKSIPSEEIVKFADDLERVTGITNNATVGVAKLLGQMTDLDDQALLKVTKSVEDLATAFDKDLGGTAFQVSAILNGFTNRVRGTTIAVGDHLTVQERLNEILRQTAPLADVAAKRSETFTGAMRKMSAAGEDLKTHLGGPLIGPLTSLTNAMTDLIRVVDDFVQHHQALVAGLSAVALALGGLGTVLAGIKIAGFLGIIEHLTKLGAVLVAFPVTTLVTIATLLGIFGLAFLKTSSDLEKGKGFKELEANAARLEALQARLKQLNDELSKLPKDSADPGFSRTLGQLKNGIETQKAQIEAELEALQKAQIAIRAARATNTTDPEVVGPLGPNAARTAEDTARSIKDTIDKTASQLDKARADVAAGAKQMLSDTTGSFAALQESFAIRIKSARDLSDANVKNFIRDLENQKNLSERQLRSNPEFQKQITEFEKQQRELAQTQVDTIGIEKQKSFIQFREQSEKTREGNLKALADDAQKLADLEQKHLDVLVEQNATLDEQLTQSENIAAAQRIANDANIKALQTEKSFLEGEIASGRAQDDKRAQALNRIIAINTALKDQAELGAQIARDEGKRVAQLSNQADQRRQEAFKGVQALAEAQVDADQKRLSLLQKFDAPLESQLALILEIGKRQQDNNDALIRDLEAQAATQRDLRDNTKLSDQDRQTALNTLNQINATLTKQKALTAGITEDTKQQAVNAITRRTEFFKATLDARNTSDEAELTVLRQQLRVAEDLGASYQDQLTIAQQIDVVQRNILQTKIEDAKQALANAQIKSQGRDSPEVTRAQSQLDALKKTFDSFLGSTYELEQKLVNQARSLADSFASEFSDDLITLMTDKDAKITDIFANLGKRFVSQFIQAATSTLLEKPFFDMLKDWSQAAPEATNQLEQGRGPGGAAFGGILDLFGIHIPRAQANPNAPGGPGTRGARQPGADLAASFQTPIDALTDAADTYDTATSVFADTADTYNTATSTYETATTAFANAVEQFASTPSQTPTTTGDGGKVGVVPVPTGDSTDEQDQEQLSQAVNETAESMAVLSKVSDKTGLAFGEASYGIGSFLSTIGRAIGGGGGGALGIAGSIFGLLGGIAGAFTGAGGGVAGGASASAGWNINAMVPKYNLAAGAHGMMVLPHNFIRPFQRGGVVNGPVLGLIGEEGPEIVAKMKPSSSTDWGGKQAQPQVIINGDIIPRQQNMRPEDVVRIVYQSMDRGGPLAKATQTVIKRSK